MYRKAKADKTLGKNLPLLLRSRAHITGDIALQGAKDKDGKFVYYSYRDVYRRVIEVATSLCKLGIKRNSHVGLISDNRREWLIIDMALLSIGAQDVPRGCDSTGHEIRFILNFADCAFSVFENGKQLEKVLEEILESPLLKTAILFDAPDEKTVKRADACGVRIVMFSSLESEGEKASDAEKSRIEHEMDITNEGDIATIIFTSGTTGVPKGVMLTHDNYMALMEYVQEVLPAETGDKWLSILPVWHSFERSVQYFAITLKTCLCYSKPIGSVMLQDLLSVKPQWICAVPRLWESFARGVYKTMRKAGGLSYNIFRFAIGIGIVRYWAKERLFGLRCRFKKSPRIFDSLIGLIPFLVFSPLYFIFDALVYKKIRERFGGKLKAGISGGGSLPPEIDAFYHAVGISLLEGYGITETAPVLSVRSLKKQRSGCVGEVYPSSEVKVVKEENGNIVSKKALAAGERGILLVRGRQVMKGYYKRDDLTRAALDKDGWFNTGDIVSLSVDNEIKIFGRAKDTIVLRGGENIEPFLIEQALCGSPFIENAVVVGQDQKYIAALIVPAKDPLMIWAKQNEINITEWPSLLKSESIGHLIQSEINERVSTKSGFRACERVFKFVLLPESFKSGREINAKMEVMRYKIASLYKKEIASLF